MEIDYNCVRRVVINHTTLWWHKPDKNLIVLIGQMIPDARIVGFGRYTIDPFGVAQGWYLMVESKTKFANPYWMPVGNITTSQLIAEYKSKATVKLLPPPSDTSA